MTRSMAEAYRQGFMRKCAEYGVGARTAMGLMKRSGKSPAAVYANIAAGTDKSNAIAMLTGGLGGAILGGIQEEENRKKQLRNAIIGALLGAGGAYLGTRSSKPLLGHIGRLHRQLGNEHRVFD